MYINIYEDIVPSVFPLLLGYTGRKAGRPATSEVYGADDVWTFWAATIAVVLWIW